MANKSNADLWTDIRGYKKRIAELEPLSKENARLMEELDLLKDKIDEAEHRAEKLAYQLKGMEAAFAKKLIKSKQKAREEGYMEGRTAR